jgi:hypothetical protein
VVVDLANPLLASRYPRHRMRDPLSMARVKDSPLRAVLCLPAYNSQRPWARMRHHKRAVAQGYSLRLPWVQVEHHKGYLHYRSRQVSPPTRATQAQIQDPVALARCKRTGLHHRTRMAQAFPRRRWNPARPQTLSRQYHKVGVREGQLCRGEPAVSRCPTSRLCH